MSRTPLLSLGVAAIVACDRMITAGDIQYEPQQTKFAIMTPRILVSIAGDYSIHSEALLETRKQIGINANIHPQSVAILYGKAIQAIKRRQAEDLHLAPLGMNTDTFLAQQRELLDSVANRLTDQLQNFEGQEVEALVVGSDGHDVLLYSVDTKGMIYYLNDVGFGAIGMGAWHAKSRLMQNGYVNTAVYAQALAAAYAAKKVPKLLLELVKTRICTLSSRIE
jgi:20S proteasome alpha/beta subunit